ncbi:ABC transporter ATP-binding protein [Gracilibacillus caseinilyticus]|uniref:ABC transporter ATP-binding protein n=1 Tax=Gracilibacillus caseinilyticus TaxID=2932256 RepID=A0ABY4F1G3_9BACI|nr:ABC transporter ATP-binding protein [Gracilibacillus caseinilyticus]UOQ49907.1 ABC transporter ATP-binding protein [Gracilibacillus caseinilyticus]
MNTTLAEETVKQQTIENVVRMSGVSKVFPNGNVAVDNVNIDIAEGEFISFVGPSGCGKSTIFKMISGLIDNTQGSIEILGSQMNPMQQKRTNVGFVFQDSTLLPWRSVLENVMLPLEFQKKPKKEKIEEATQALELVGLEDYTKSLPRQLSGGMKMRVSIARALVAKPKLLLMDEPFGALDEITRQSLQSELLRIWESQKMTVLFITHNVFEAVYLSTRVAVMTPSPGKVASTLDVPLPFPRNDEVRTTHEFSDIVAQVSRDLKF